jgi:type VI secretion system protein ImpA
MPLSEDLLQPIAGTNPSGQNLRYVLYSSIKEARREDDEAPQGDWTHERKRADYSLVYRLCCDALANQTKDIQLVVWATEAALKLEGLPGLQTGLNLLAKLIDGFWDTLYPEIEDGDAGLRSGALDALGGKFSSQLLYLPLTRDGLNWLQYKDSRTIGYEADATGSDDKQRIREEALSDGRVSGEMFDAALSKTSRVFYEEQLNQVNACLAALETLNETCVARMGDDGPNFASLRDGLEDFRQVVTILLRQKREDEPETTREQPAASVMGESSEVEEGHGVSSSPSPTVPAIQPISKEPQDCADAIDRIILATHYLRRQDPANPMPYLVLRALRWGELRANVEDLDLFQLEAPSTEIRKRLRALLQNGDWQQLLDACEVAMALPCGRGWLDLQRYAVSACDNLGSSYTAVSTAILSTLESLLGDLPKLSQSSLNDETATANPETQSWLQELIDTKQRPLAQDLSVASDRIDTTSQGQKLAPDSYELAKDAASSGRPQEAIAILEREAAQERSGRGRFQRRVQLAQICMAAGYRSVALPILEALAREIDDRKLEDWEDPDLVIHALGLLYQCMDKLKSSTEQKEKIYARICRLGPVQALELAK